jgi:copper chaperone NosL
MSTTIYRRGLLAVALSALIGTACARSDTATEPVWGKEPCAHCKMLVSDKRYAAQVVDQAGEHRFFDDIGCMVLWMAAHESSPKAWVREATSGAWLDARTAKYVQGARTPMDFGVEARATGDVSFDAARDAVLAKKRSDR